MDQHNRQDHDSRTGPLPTYLHDIEGRIKRLIAVSDIEAVVVAVLTKSRQSFVVSTATSVDGYGSMCTRAMRMLAAEVVKTQELDAAVPTLLERIEALEHQMHEMADGQNGGER